MDPYGQFALALPVLGYAAKAALGAAAGAIVGTALGGWLSDLLFDDDEKENPCPGMKAEHKKNKRKSAKNKHQKGKTRNKRDRHGGEKGDARRPYRR